MELGRRAGAARPHYIKLRGEGGRAFVTARDERPRGRRRGRRARTCITRPDSPPPGRGEGAFGREPHLQRRPGLVELPRGVASAEPNSPAAASRGNQPWPRYPTRVPAAASCGLGWPRGPVALAGGSGRPGGKDRGLPERGASAVLPGALVPGPGRAHLAPRPSEGYLCSGLGLFPPSSFSFYKGRLLPSFRGVVVLSGSIFVL